MPASPVAIEEFAGCSSVSPMYDIKQFRPTLYLLVLLGVSGFAVAAEAPGLWVLSVPFILVNGWLVSAGRFKPWPRWLSSIVSIGAAVYSFTYFYEDVSNHAGSPILYIGEFLVAMQVVKLWEQRSNRDYATTLSLSLLLMVAAAISTASLVFGLILIVYLFLSLYCSLLLHLKVETDEARAALTLPEHRLSPAALKQDQHLLSQSMRRLTAAVSVFAVACAVLVFLFFPRSAAGRWFGQFQWRPQETMTGFSDQVNYQQLAKITRNNELVATVKMWRDGKLVDGTEPLLFRGLTLDYYSGVDDNYHPSFQWTRSVSRPTDDEVAMHAPWNPIGAIGTPHYRQEVTLNNTGSPVLFSVAGPVSVTLEKAGRAHALPLEYFEQDESIQSLDSLPQQVIYTADATGSLGPTGGAILDPFRGRSQIAPEIESIAREPAVSGPGLLDRRRVLLDARPRGMHFGPTDVDEQIATNLEHYLRSNFSYTLDLTDVDSLNGRDPIVAFLTDFKRGHCEYFAGAMTLMCQSLGLDARMVVGFVCDDYNSFGHFYQVRQSQAHAWVEVLTTHGWVSFDPTSGHEAESTNATTWQKTKHLFDFFEYTWANAIVAYDADNRETLIQHLQSRVSKTASHGSLALSGVRNLLDEMAGWLAIRIVGPLIVALSGVLVLAVGWFAYERWLLRRRASRIGIGSLPASAQHRLLRQLGFYDDLMRLLERHNIERPRHLTPLEFSQSLSYLPADVYDTIHRLTELFYRVRYGQAEINPARHRHLDNMVQRLAASLARLET
jgi:hypothetical protein